MSESHPKLLAERNRSEFDALVRQVAVAPPPLRAAAAGLMFAVDATASRQPTWDRACYVQAEKLVLRGVPAFTFREADDPVAERAFQQVSRLTHGACARFDAGSMEILPDLLVGVAVYVAGGRKAFAEFAERAGGVVARLTHQLRRCG